MNTRLFKFFILKMCIVFGTIPFFSSGQYASKQAAISGLDSINRLPFSKIDSVTYQRALVKLQCFVDLGNADSATMVLERLRKNEKQLPGEILSMLALEEVKLWNLKGQFGKSIWNARLNYTLLSSTVNQRTRINFYIALGQAFIRTGVYDSSSIYCNKAIALSKQYKYPDLEVKSGRQMAVVYEFLKQPEKMRHHLTAVLKIANQYGLHDEKMLIIGNLGVVEMRLNNYGKAIEYFNQCLPYFERTDNKKALSLAFTNLAFAQVYSNQYESALSNVYKSIRLRELSKDSAGLARSYHVLAKVMVGLNKIDSALIYAHKSLSMSLPVPLAQNSKETYELLADVYEKKGDLGKTIDMLKSAALWRDSLAKSERDITSQQILGAFQMQYADSLMLYNQKLSIGKRNQLISWSFIGLLLIIMGGVVVVFRKKYSLLAKAHLDNEKKISENKKDDIMGNSYYIGEVERLNDIIQQQRDKLTKLQQERELQSEIEISRLRRLLQDSDTRNDGYWNEFMLQFSKVYPHFFESIKSRFSEATQHELRICALIKLNLGLLDSANILNISPDSVRKARYRLYKKMQLESDQQLTELIMLT